MDRVCGFDIAGNEETMTLDAKIRKALGDKLPIDEFAAGALVHHISVCPTCKKIMEGKNVRKFGTDGGEV